MQATGMSHRGVGRWGDEWEGLEREDTGDRGESQGGGTVGRGE